MNVLDWLDFFPDGLPGMHNALFHVAAALALCASPAVLGRWAWAPLGWFMAMNAFLLWAPTDYLPRDNPVIGLALVHAPWVLFALDLVGKGRASRLVAQVPLRDWLLWSGFRGLGGVYVLALINGDLPPRFAAEIATGEVFTALGGMGLWWVYRPQSLWHRGLLLFWNAYGLTSALAMGFKLALANPELPFRRLPQGIHWYFMGFPQSWGLFFFMPLSVAIHLSVFFKLYQEWKAVSAPAAAPSEVTPT